MTVPLDEITAELERLGVRELDPKAFLLGYLIGRDWGHGMKATLWIIRALYGRERSPQTVKT